MVQELTTDKLVEGIRQLVLHESRQQGGPSLDREAVVCGVVTDPDLLRVLEVKGELVIRVKRVPAEVVGMDDGDPCAPADPSEYTEGMRQLRQLAAVAGSRHSDSPLGDD